MSGTVGAVASGTIVRLPNGLTTGEAAARLRRDGPNVLPAPRPPPPAMLLLRQMTHFFALLLWAAAGMAYVGGMPQLAVAIVIVVMVNGAFAFAQEYRADRAGRRLRELLPARVIVVRDGKRTVVDAAELVVGDVVALEAGDRVPADLELLDVHSLAINESMLTGESAPAGLTRVAGHTRARSSSRERLAP
jgi:magnesium-transporting ATPase (P-type)